MAYLDPRFYAHPKVAGLSDRAFRVYVSALCYCDGFNTRGVLEPGALRVIGCRTAAERELVDAGLWHHASDPITGEVLPGFLVHDWEEKNGRAADKRQRERERKAAYRARLRGGEL